MNAPEPSGLSGRAVVVGFLLVCAALAAISLLVTLFGQWAPPPPPEAPPIRDLPTR